MIKISKLFGSCEEIVESSDVVQLIIVKAVENVLLREASLFDFLNKAFLYDQSLC
jgi:hypothetical protein